MPEEEPEEPEEVEKEKEEEGPIEHTSQTYYSIAHTIKETVTSQPGILVNGSLKEYQIKVGQLINYSSLSIHLIL